MRGLKRVTVGADPGCTWGCKIRKTETGCHP